MIANLKPYAEYKESGLPWLGQVPGHWDVRVLKRLCLRSALYGANIPASDYVASGVRFLRTTDITDDGVLRRGGVFVSSRDAESYMLSDGDLLVSRSGTIGRSLRYRAHLHGPCSYAGYLVRFVPSQAASPDYLFHFTKSIPFNDFIRVSAVSSTIENVNGDKFANMPVILPPPAEQAAIVRFLDWANGRLERAIRAKRKVIALLGEQKQAIIHRAVTRGLDPSVPLKPSGIPWLGDIPQHWEVRSFLRCTTERADYRGATPEKVEAGVFLVTAKNVRKGWIDYETSKEFVRESEYAKIMRRGMARMGDVLLTMEAPLGHFALIDREDIALAQRVVRFRLNPSLLLPPFALHCLNSPYFQSQLLERATGSTAQGIKASKLPQLVVARPDVAEQESIVEYVGRACAPLDVVISRLNREIELLREYRTRLVADVVTGKLDVREAALRLPEEAPPDTAEDDADLNTDAEAADEEAAV